MKILLAGTIKRRITEDITASRSTVVFELGKKLAEKGHEVTLLGTSDSLIPGVKTIGIIEKGLADLPVFENAMYVEISYLVALEKKLEEIAAEFDIVHNHTYLEFINLFASERIKTPMVTTLHAQATPEYDNVLSLFPKSNLVSISNAHRNLFKKAKIEFVVHNGVDKEIFSFEEQKEDYLLWIGRLGRAKDSNGNFVDAKGVKWAIELARKTGEKLLLFGNVEDMDFYNNDVKPFLDDKIKWVNGIVSSEQKLSHKEVADLMRKAKAFLMPINWEEPFGLVMAEAMSCGTPVIGFNKGSVSEIVRDGLTGYIVDCDNQEREGRGSWIIKKQGMEGLIEAIQHLNTISETEYLQIRQNCRRHVEENFTIEKMVEGYENVYNQILGKTSAS
jgi:glycosyltransferase involved in cell wall biosynthesis